VAETKVPVKTRVVEIIATEFHKSTEELKDSTSFEAIGADSLDVIEMIMELERDFNIDITDEETDRMKTVGDAIAIVEAKLQA
jgi:acyl carrier protein